jgi:hypothetical protein
MLLEALAGEQPVMIENGCYAVAALLALLILRIWYYYKFQMRAMEIAAPLIRKAICAHLYAGSEFRFPFRYGLKTELQMILDLSKWRFRDFFPGLADEEEEVW